MQSIIFISSIIVLFAIILIQTVKINYLIKHCEFLNKSFNDVSFKYSESLDERIKEHEYYKNELEELISKMNNNNIMGETK